MLNKILFILFISFTFLNVADAGHRHKHDKKKEIFSIEVTAWSYAYNMHLERAIKYHNEAIAQCNEMCGYGACENLSCFQSACELINSDQPSDELIYSISSLIKAFGFENVPEWVYLKQKLVYSSFHFEMAQFYKEILTDMDLLILNNK